MTQFQPGDRVVLEGNWEFADGIVGTVAEPFAAIRELVEADEAWTGHVRVVSILKGPLTCYWVVFDEAHDDGSGDGPYRAAEIDEPSLRPLLSPAEDET